MVSNASPRLDPATYSNMILSGHFDGDNFADIFTIRDNDQLITTSTTLAANRTPIQALGIDGSSSAGELAVIGDFNGDGLEDAIILGTNAVRFLSDGTDFDLGFNFGSVIGGAIGGIGTARTGRVM